MKKQLLFIFSICIINLAFTQERALKITNQASKKETIIKEHKRIRVKTDARKKISGRFKIVDKSTILIKKERLKLASIIKIKRHPLLLSIITNGFFIYVGLAVSAVGLISGAITGQSSFFLLTAPGAAMIFTGFKSPNFLRAYKTQHNYRYELITIE